MVEKLKKIDFLHKQIQGLDWQAATFSKANEIEYTFESNGIEGNTLTLQETALIIEKGVTIGGKSLREHLEVINHQHAIDFIKEIVKNKEPIQESILLAIHRLVLMGIDQKNAGMYRKVPVLISGSKHLPPAAYLIQEKMEEFFEYLKNQKEHPLLFAAEAHERLVTIHPFMDGNGRTARLLMNLILLQNHFPILILKANTDQRLLYYNSLEKAQITGVKEDFFDFICENMIVEMERIINFFK